MTTPKASGPLWTWDGNYGDTPFSVFGADCGGMLPCRLIPGHGRVVPVELVEAISRASDKAQDKLAEFGDTTPGDWDCVIDAIRAALEGAV